MGLQDLGTWDLGPPLKFKSGTPGLPSNLKVGPRDPPQSLKVGTSHLSLMNSIFFQNISSHRFFIFFSFLNNMYTKKYILTVR